MDRFDAMQAFARVVEAGSFTKAADTLHMGKTTVTQLVQQLEARLRVKLLHRTTRRVQLTADGAAYYERVLRLLADLDDAETSLSSAAALPRGRLRVDVPSPWARLVLVPSLPAFHARYPDLQLDIGASDRMVDVVADNVDCVVRGGTVTHPSLVARQVGALALRVWASPRYLERAGVPQHPHDLADTHHRTVGFLWSRTGRPFPYAMHRGTERVEVQGRHDFSVDDGNAYLAAGLAGLGIVLAARLHGGSTRGPRRAAARVRRLAARPHADVGGLRAEPARQRQAAGVHRLGGGVDGRAGGRGRWGRLGAGRHAARVRTACPGVGRTMAGKANEHGRVRSGKRYGPRRARIFWLSGGEGGIRTLGTLPYA